MNAHTLEHALQSHPAVEAVRVSEIHDDKERGLLAFVVPSLEALLRRNSESLERDQTAYWQQLYDAVYQSGAATTDATFNLAGWNSGYDRKPIDAEVMRAWVEDTVSRIQLFRPRRVLEIGCGTGLLLFRIAPHCTTYYATDLSSAAIRHVDSALRSKSNRSPSSVKLLTQAADDFTGIPTGELDLVILNSVTQHFPGERYLFRVLESAVRALAPGGKIYLGDIRDLDLARALRFSIAVSRAAPHTQAQELRAQLLRMAELDQELQISPGYFRCLPDRLPAIKAVEIQLKRDAADSEMSRFRYEAVLHTSAQPWIAHRSRFVWSGPGSLRLLASTLEARAPKLVQVCGVPNLRVASHIRALQRFDAAPPSDDVLCYRDALRAPPLSIECNGLRARALVRFGRSKGYEVELHAPESGDRALLDVVLRRRNSAGPRALPLQSAAGCAEYQELINNPLRGKALQNLGAELRAYLKSCMATEGVRAMITFVDALPTSNNPATDRQNARNTTA